MNLGVKGSRTDPEGHKAPEELDRKVSAYPGQENSRPASASNPSGDSRDGYRSTCEQQTSLSRSPGRFKSWFVSPRRLGQRLPKRA